MLMPEAQVRIWLYAPATDMRKSFDGLAALVRQKLAEDPLSGQLFVFLNRRRTQLKILYFDRSGYCVWAKRLEQSQFHLRGEGEKQGLAWTELKLILEGIDLRSIRRFKRWGYPFNRTRCMLERWLTRAPARTIRGPLASSMRGSKPMRTAWTTSNGYDGPQASPVRPAATMMAGDWVMGASSALDAATAPR